MSAETIEQVLARMESGETTAADAAALREYLALKDLQDAVQATPQNNAQLAAGAWLREHGARDGWNDAQFAARMAVWAQVELADLLQLFHIPDAVGHGLWGPAVYSVMGVVELAAALSTTLLGSWELWDGCGVNLELPPERFEARLVELLVPLLALADVLQIDVRQSVLHHLQGAAVEAGG